MRKAAGFLRYVPVFPVVLTLGGWPGLPGSLAAQESAASTMQPAAQPVQLAAPAVAHIVPQMMRYTGVAANRAGETVEATFRVYAGAQGGDALWSETQRVRVGQDGRFSVLLGAVTEGGLPQGLFSLGQGQWLAVSIEHTEEQPRVKLASVAYAMKAADAETLGGLAAAEFVTQAQLDAATQALEAGTEALGKANPESGTAVTGSGTTYYVPVWTGTSTLGNSPIKVSGANVGIDASGPVYPLDVNGMAVARGGFKAEPNGGATAAAGLSSSPIEFEASAYSSTAHAAIPEYFIWQVQPTGNNTASPGAMLALSATTGTTTKPTGFSFGPTGQITFATGQKFPAADLEATLNPVYAQLGASNTFNGSATINGSGSFEYDLNVGGVLQVNGGAAILGGLIVDNTLQAGSTTNSLAYNFPPENDGLNAFSDYGYGIFAYSTNAQAGYFQNQNNLGTPFPPPGVGFYDPAVDALNTGSGGALEAHNHGYGTAAYIYSDVQSSVSENQIAKYNAGLWADSHSMNGMIGSSDYYNGGSFFNNSSAYATVLARNFSSGGTGLVVGEGGKDFGGVVRAEGQGGVCGINTAGDVSCTGEVKMLAATQGGTRQVETYSMQSPESWLEDFGSGNLDQGTAQVQLDPAFADAANTGVEYHVFLTPKGEAESLYVINETATGFEVRESKHGADSIAFDYRIVAKRRGHESERLVDVTERFAAEKAAADNPPTAPVGEAPGAERPMSLPHPRQAPVAARPAQRTGAAQKRK